MIRLKNAEDLAIARVIGVDIRVSLRKGSRRFSKELALDWTKQFTRSSIASYLSNWSSILAVSSCSLEKYVLSKSPVMTHH